MKKWYLLLLLLVLPFARASAQIGMILEVIKAVMTAAEEKKQTQLLENVTVNTSRGWRLNEYTHDEKAIISEKLYDFYKVKEVGLMADEIGTLSQQIINHPALLEYGNQNEVKYYRGKVDAVAGSATVLVKALTATLSEGRPILKNQQGFMVSTASGAISLGKEAFALSAAAAKLDDQYADGLLTEEEYNMAKAKLEARGKEYMQGMIDQTLGVLGFVGDMLGVGGMSVSDSYDVPLNQDVMRMTDGERIKVIDEIHTRMGTLVTQLRSVSSSINRGYARQGRASNYYNIYKTLYRQP